MHAKGLIRNDRIAYRGCLDQQLIGSAMNAIDRQSSAVRTPGPVAHFVRVADGMHALLVKRADDLEGCSEGSPEEAELAAISDAIEAYEDLRWPTGKVSGGKG
jgi:hypothetical protein